MALVFNNTSALTANTHSQNHDMSDDTCNIVTPNKHDNVSIDAVNVSVSATREQVLPQHNNNSDILNIQFWNIRGLYDKVFEKDLQ